MLKLFSRLRKPVETVRGVAARPLWVLESRRPQLADTIWATPYCCTMVYFWTALVTEQLCDTLSASRKRKVLQRVFAGIVTDMGGDPVAARGRVLPEGHPGRRRALVDLKRVVTLYSGTVNEKLMIYEDYRKALADDGREALPGNRWDLHFEAAHEILLARLLADEVTGGQNPPRAYLP